MTKSDYFTVAKAIKEAFPKDHMSKSKLLKHLIPALRSDNPNFQSFRFITACDATDLLDVGEISL